MIVLARASFGRKMLYPDAKSRVMWRCLLARCRLAVAIAVRAGLASGLSGPAQSSQKPHISGVPNISGIRRRLETSGGPFPA
jgi:hypothetical protein